MWIHYYDDVNNQDIWLNKDKKVLIEEDYIISPNNENKIESFVLKVNGEVLIFEENDELIEKILHSIFLFDTEIVELATYREFIEFVLYNKKTVRFKKKGAFLMCPYCYDKENEINKFIYLSLYA